MAQSINYCPFPNIYIIQKVIHKNLKTLFVWERDVCICLSWTQYEMSLSNFGTLQKQITVNRVFI